MNCHLEIEHGRAPPSPAAETGGGGCVSCHGASHSPQTSLYAGLGGRGVPRMPSPMFTAGVKCEGCHNPEFLGRDGGDAVLASAHTPVASEVACMACHGPGYSRIYRAWKEGVEARTSALSAQLQSSAPAMGSAPPADWVDARLNFLLVERGRGIHNVNFAYALLEKAHDQLNAARAARGLGPLSRPWASVPTGNGNCLSCHQGVERQSGAFAGHAFSHAPHLLSGKLECAACHRPHAERAPGEVVRFGREGCVPCHHRGLAPSAPACGKCHGDITARTLKSFRGEFSHKAHLDVGLECASCHAGKGPDPRPEKPACRSCHEQ
jgi:hypothetical protein